MAGYWRFDLIVDKTTIGKFTFSIANNGPVAASAYNAALVGLGDGAYMD